MQLPSCESSQQAAEPTGSKSRHWPCHILREQGIPCVVWFEDAIAFHGVPTVVFDLYIIVPEISITGQRFAGFSKKKRELQVRLTTCVAFKQCTVLSNYPLKSSKWDIFCSQTHRQGFPKPETQHTCRCGPLEPNPETTCMSLFRLFNAGVH
jgi:hypothetical protein